MLRWRWLWIWVGMLAAGCGQVWSTANTPASTREPALPLLGYTLIPPTLTPALWSLVTPTPLITADTGNLFPLALYLAVSGSACYETPVGSLVCLGVVRNQWDKPVEQVAVAVELLAQDGTPLVTREAPVSRWELVPGAAGPYRVLFETPPPGYAGARTSVIAAQAVPITSRQVTTLALQPASGTFVLDHYQVTFSVVNRGPVAVEQMRVTMMLFDDRGQLTGFRQVPLEAARRLAPGESLALTIKVIPQGRHTVRFEAFAEGYRVLE